MSSNWGKQIKISIFGESHGPAIGVTIDGLPFGIKLEEQEILAFMSRRAPGNNAYSTARRETDAPKILSGCLNGQTTGAPLCAVIENADARSADYAQMQTLARPGHADYTAHIRYNGCNDVRGGGHFSGRLTAPLVFAGAVAKSALHMRGIVVGAHIAAIHGVEDTGIDAVNIKADQLDAVAAKSFPVFDDEAGKEMQVEIEKAKQNCDSVGGVVGCCALGVPPGIGSPMFDGLENKIASIIFGIPAVKGLEFGAGFGLANSFGSESNDGFREENGKVVTETNRQGGILGGISNGMPITLWVAFKPTPTIALKQKTIDYKLMRNAEISSTGRHDPCIVPRAVVCVEAAVALALLDSILERGE